MNSLISKSKFIDPLGFGIKVKIGNKTLPKDKSIDVTLENSINLLCDSLFTKYEMLLKVIGQSSKGP